MELNKKYRISNKMKKCYVEYETFRQLGIESTDRITIETGFRTGEWIVCPKNTEEIAMLEEASAEGFEDDLCISDFQDAEFEYANDGCWSETDWSEYASDDLDRYCDMECSYLLDNGWDTDENICIFLEQITIEAA